MKKKDILVFTILFLSFLILCSIISELDSIWGYGFSYNIASGLVPYRDFNMVIGPIYSIIFSFLIRLFGNYYILFALEHSLFYSLVLTFVYKKIKKNTFYVFLCFILSLTICGYNVFCASLVLAILLLLDSKLKYKDFLMGLIVGIIIFTKHNIGLPVFLVYFFSSKDKIKSILYIVPVGLFVLLYLLINNCLYGYIDYCILGLGSFLENFYIDIFSFVIFLVMLIFTIYDYRRNKDIKVLYCASFMIVFFPIANKGHVVISFIPFSYYYFLKYSDHTYKVLIKMFIIFGIVARIKEGFTNNLVLNNNYFFLQCVPNGVINYLDNYSNNLDKFSDEEVYLFLDNAYLIKIYRNENPNKYDLINKGNLGSHPENLFKDIDENCENRKCVFVLDKLFFYKSSEGTGQRSELFKNYVINNYLYSGDMPSGDKIYTNY